MRSELTGFLFALALCYPATASAQDTESTDDADVLAGHSYHGEAFNEGPRQQAWLMPGLGRSSFPVSTDSKQAQRFFNQGIDQLHGFWYFEAERSFRQVVVLDPDCAMAYWGLAMANVNTTDRAREFVDKANEKADEEGREITDREQLYIDAINAYYDERTKDESKRAGNFADKLGEIVLQYPDDIEAKALLACQIWMNTRKKIRITSHVSVNAMLDQVFAVDPSHPAHHYRIHLWDYKDAKVALHSAARCGPSLPDVAHMWHMPGHIYSRLKRYEDAVWQQEASARVDHRNMMHDQVLPDQIHNFAHNNEWCVRNLNHVGRVRDAIDLATNMISMPRHPKYNHLDNRGSTWYGRLRLFETLSRYELWEELIENCNSSVLEPTDNELEQIKRLRYLARASFRSGDRSSGETILQQLRDQLELAKSTRSEKEMAVRQQEQSAIELEYENAEKLAGLTPQFLRREFHNGLRIKIRKKGRDRLAKSLASAKREATSLINVVNRAIQELEGYQLVADENYDDAIPKLKKAGEVDALYRAWVSLKAGQTDQAIKQARRYVKSHENEVQPLANLSWLLWEAGKTEEAVEVFHQLRKISGSIDPASPVFQRLDVVADSAGITGDWRTESPMAGDLGERPDLASLGPFRWQPGPASGWELVDSGERTLSDKHYQGKPVIVIFYLGHGCLHCAEQLQKFAPMMEEYKKAGIEMVAISTDDREGLKKSIDAYGDVPLPIQLLANPGLEVFKSWRVFDEFENQPLHGTFLVDENGRIRWQDVSYEPFMEPEFLLKESVRLLSQPPPIIHH